MARTTRLQRWHDEQAQALDGDDAVLPPRLSRPEAPDDGRDRGAVAGARREQVAGIAALNGPMAVSVLDASRLMGIGRTTIWDMVRSGEVPARRLPRNRVVIMVSDLHAWASGLPYYSPMVPVVAAGEVVGHIAESAPPGAEQQADGVVQLAGRRRPA